MKLSGPDYHENNNFNVISTISNLSCGCTLGSKPLPGFFNDGQFDSLTLGKGYPRLRPLANGIHIAQTSCEFMTRGILDVNCLEASLLLLSALYYTNTAPVPSTSHHDHIPHIKLDEVSNLVALQVKLDGVIGLDDRVWVADGSPIIGVQIWDAFLPKLHRPDFAELKLQSRCFQIRINLTGNV